MPDMTGKIALISGGARGMGASHAKAIVAAGGKVVIGDVLDADGELTAKNLGDDARYTHLDVTKLADWEAAVKVATEEFGGLNVLINNAGIENGAPIAEFTEEMWNRIIAINLTGVFFGIKAAAAELIRCAPSAIVNISSTDGLIGDPFRPGYVASKWGVRGMTKTFAAELGAHNVRCNSIHPGVILTPMTQGLGMTESAPVGALGRPGRPEEVSRLVLFLASDDSSYSTGGEFLIDGGMLSSMPLPEG